MNYGLAILLLFLQTILPPFMQKKPSGGGGTVTEVQAPAASGYSSSSATKAYASNVTSGDLLIAGADANSGTQSISSTGAGCPSSWNLANSVTTGSVLVAVWSGTAAATGACSVTSSGGGSVNVTIAEYAPSGSALDTSGENSNTSGTTLTVNAGAATVGSGEYGWVYYAENGSSTVSASGWSIRFSGSNYDGVATQSGIGSGVTVQFAGTGFSSGNSHAAVLAVIKP